MPPDKTSATKKRKLPPGENEQMAQRRTTSPAGVEEAFSNSDKNPNTVTQEQVEEFDPWDAIDAKTKLAEGVFIV